MTTTIPSTPPVAQNLEVPHSVQPSMGEYKCFTNSLMFVVGANIALTITGVIALYNAGNLEPDCDVDFDCSGSGPCREIMRCDDLPIDEITAHITTIFWATLGTGLATTALMATCGCCFNLFNKPEENQ